MEFRSINIDQKLQNESFNNIKDRVQGTKGGRVQEREDMNEAQDFHVLAVDDSSIDRKILEKLLSVSSNYHVTLVESGDKALEYLGLSDHDSHIHPSSGHDDSSETVVQQANETRVNLIMTDYSMPGMTGYDLLKRVKVTEMDFLFCSKVLSHYIQYKRIHIRAGIAMERCASGSHVVGECSFQN
ncbi:hypothetical protein Droror1_Dr00026857 [Drosera rotundifolia]